MNTPNGNGRLLNWKTILATVVAAGAVSVLGFLWTLIADSATTNLQQTEWIERNKEAIESRELNDQIDSVTRELREIRSTLEDLGM
jgi:hypothetical protein